MNHNYNVKTDSHRVGMTYPQNAKLAIYSRVITRLTTALCALSILIFLPFSSSYALTAAAISGSDLFQWSGWMFRLSCRTFNWSIGMDQRDDHFNTTTVLLRRKLGKFCTRHRSSRCKHVRYQHN